MRPYIGKLRWLVILMVPVAILVLVGGLAVVGTATTITPMHVFSNIGSEPPKLFEADHGALERINRPGANVRLLAQRTDRAFYRVGSECFAVGPAEGTEFRTGRYRFGSIVCQPDFPSSRAVVDLTMYRTTAGGDIAALRGEGFAADHVAKVGFQDKNGNIVSTTPVVNNVYSFENPPSGDIVAFVGLDSGGKVVHTQPTPGS